MKKSKLSNEFYYTDVYMYSVNYDWKQYDTPYLLGLLHHCRASAKKELVSIVKKELSTRPHIPNKIESKKIRQQKAKAQRNR